MRFVFVGVFALLLRGGVLALLVYKAGMAPELAIFPAILATAAINYLGAVFMFFPMKKICRNRIPVGV